MCLPSSGQSLWGESGTQKSPAFRIATQSLKSLQKLYSQQFDAELARYREDKEEYKQRQKQWQKTQDGDRPEEPVVPLRQRCMVQDSTIEALATVLMQNPRGVLLARDELSGWIAGFDRYAGKGSTSSEVQKWLEIYNTESITIDRKTGDNRYTFVERPSVSICGGIQPGILSRCLTDEHRSNGLQSRLLMAYPPRRPKRWSDEEVSEVTLQTYQNAIQELFTLKPSRELDGEERPTLLKLNQEARNLYRMFVDSHGQEQSAMQGHPASQWSKLEEIPARLALVIHCVRQVTEGVPDAFRIDERTMAASIRIAEWFKSETLRINDLLTEPEDVREARQLMEWIRTRGGSMTARDLAKFRRDIRSSDEADLRLADLVRRGVGEWQTIHRSRRFHLFRSPVSADCPFPQ